MSDLRRYLGKSQREKDPIEIASVAIFNSDGDLLFGKRADNGKWTLPGGHLEPGESPEGGARREAKEEAGLEVPNLERLGEGRAGAYLIHAYKATVDGKPDSSGDPDEECEEWRWVKTKSGLPAEIADNLHSPKNVTLRLLGLQGDLVMKCERGVAGIEARAELLTTLVKNLATVGASEWGGYGHVHAIIMPHVHAPGQLTVRWFDEHGMLGQTPPSPRLADVADALVEQLHSPVSTPGQLDAYARGWDPLPPPANLTKSTEVSRLLDHPDPAERTMALKLATVHEDDLARGIAHDDPAVQRAAFEHPSFKGDLLMLLMRLKDRHQLQLEALGRDDIESHHLDALYRTMLSSGPRPAVGAILQAISTHPQLSRDLLRTMWDHPMCGHCRRALTRHPACPPDLLEQVVQSALACPEMSPGSSLARDALRHPALPPSALASALKGSQGPLRLFAAQNPDLPPELITDILAGGGITRDIDTDAQVRAACLKGWNVQRSHLDTALEDVHPDVRAAVFESPSPDLSPEHVDRAISRGDLDLVEKAVQSRVASPAHREAWLAMLGTYDPFSKSEGLAKAQDPKDFKSIIRASDQAGPDLVDHRGQMNEPPEAVQHFADNYKRAVAESPLKVKPLSRKAAEGGSTEISKKLIYGAPSSGALPGEPEGTKYMVKPYHERIIRATSYYMKHPHQGWAEMANQALYHAGGIGHLHQKVHVAEHNMGDGYEYEPALVVKMEKGYRTVNDLRYNMPQVATESTKLDARKIALMDFLTGNLDRHAHNLMIHPDTGQLLAIDHPRSFQYIKSGADKVRKWKGGGPPDEFEQGNDNVAPYHFDSAINVVDPWEKGKYSSRMEMMEAYRPAIDWWDQNSTKIRTEMARQLRHINDHQVRQHIANNFEARASHLDQIAEFGIENYGDDWWKAGVDMFKPGESSDHGRALLNGSAMRRG